MPRSERSSAWPLVALFVVSGAMLVIVQMRRPSTSAEHVGLPLPPLDVAGWLNADRPLTAEDLRGKLLVVDFWASWCDPCRAEMPKMVRLYRRFHSRGLHLVGLTPEAYEQRETVAQYVRSVADLDWPIGYGAELVLDKMGITLLPTYVLYDGTGRSVWAGHYVDDLEDALVAALARAQ